MTHAFNLRWSRSNTKLEGHRVVSFGLPAGVAQDGFNTCPAKGICAGYCFARQGFYVFPWVAKARHHNLAVARGNLRRFVDLAAADLAWLTAPPRHGGRGGQRKVQHRIVRVHDSGDFFSLPYLRAWYELALRFQRVRFYAYTKMFARLAPAMWDEKPRNFHLVQSLGGQDDDQLDMEKPHARVFLSQEDRARAGYQDATADDTKVVRGVLRLGLVFHGSNRPLTQAQRQALALDPAQLGEHRHNRTGWRDGAGLRVVR